MNIARSPHPRQPLTGSAAGRLPTLAYLTTHSRHAVSHSRRHRGSGEARHTQVSRMRFGAFVLLSPPCPLPLAFWLRVGSPEPPTCGRGGSLPRPHGGVARLCDIASSLTGDKAVTVRRCGAWPRGLCRRKMRGTPFLLSLLLGCGNTVSALSNVQLRAFSELGARGGGAPCPALRRCRRPTATGKKRRSRETKGTHRPCKKERFYKTRNEEKKRRASCRRSLNASARSHTRLNCDFKRCISSRPQFSPPRKPPFRGYTLLSLTCGDFSPRCRLRIAQKRAPERQQTPPPPRPASRRGAQGRARRKYVVGTRK